MTEHDFTVLIHVVYTTRATSPFKRSKSSLVGGADVTGGHRFVNAWSMQTADAAIIKQKVEIGRAHV